jgi:two-component system, sensor histidine kinase LadS
MKHVAGLLFFFSLVISCPLYSQITLTDDRSVDEFASQVEYIIDPSHQLSFKDVIEGADSSRFKRYNGAHLNFGYTRATIWLRFKVINKTDKDWYFEFAHPLVDSAVFYKLGSEVIKRQGKFFPVADRDVKTNFKIFSLDLKKDSSAEYYLKINCSESLLIQARFAILKDIIEKKHLNDFGEGIYHGFILMIILYNLFIFFVIRDRIYIYYLIFALLVQLSLLYGDDYMAELFWPHNGSLSYYGSQLYALAGIFSILFSTRFLNTKTNSPGLYKISLVFIALFLGASVLNLTGLDYYSALVQEYIGFLAMIYLLTIGWKALRGGWKPARFYLLAWAPLLAGMFIFVLRDLEYIPANSYTYYAFQVGSALEILLFSLALGSRINEYKRAKEYARKQMFQSLEEKEKLVRDQNILLEQKVKERTHALEQKNSIITNSIDYAKIIQEAILSSEDELKAFLPDSFVFHLPKSVLSGDFYWVSKFHDNVRVGAVDCTGHGVPAALMSLLGFNMLENLSKSPLIETPAGILDMLDHYVNQAVKTKEAYKAGMSLSMIQIDRKENKLLFAGARSMIYIIRNRELIQVKSEEMSIGFQYPAAENGFTDHTVDLMKGDMIYLFSDGFADQFGGPRREKFFYRSFRDLLVSISDLPTNEQQARIATAFESWRGEEEQTDDVLVLGLRY